MATLDATVGGASANAYAAVADGDTYFDERLQASAWTGESDAAVKTRALIMATRRLDQETFVGYKNSTSQALEWPREDAYDRDGEEYTTTAIPTVIKHAMFEIALAFLNSNADSSDPMANDGLERFDRARVGPMYVDVNHAHRATDLPDHVRRMLSHVLESQGLMGTLERM